MWVYRVYDRHGIKAPRLNTYNMGSSSALLNILRRLIGRRNPEPKIYPEVFYKAAGVVFTNGIHFLAAYQPYKNPGIISGIGGSKEPGETLLHTAIRETIEELFEYKKVPVKMIEAVIESVPYKKIIKNGSYVFLLYSFHDLIKLLKVVKGFGLVSPLYTVFPLTLNDLVFSRILGPAAELSHLAILPLISDLKIDANLLEDIPQIIGHV
jgi:8-oxo-dGTP pyrophosphatase MutT (NUDIX family)